MNEKDFLITPSDEEIKETVAGDTATVEVKEAEIKEVVFEKTTPVVKEAPKMSFLADDREEKSAPKPFLAEEPAAAPVVEKAPVVEEAPKMSFLADDREEKPAPKPFLAEEPAAAPVVEKSPVVEEAPKMSFLADDSADEKKEEPEKNPNYMVRSFITEDEAQDSVDKQKFERTKGKKEKEKKRRKLRTYQQRQNRLGYAFMAPWILGFIVFTLFPFVATIVLSFTNVKQSIRGFEITFNGVDNYITAFIQNPDFTPKLLEYLKVIIPYTFIIVVISFIIAFLLNKIVAGKGVLRTIYFLPVIIMSGPVMNQITSVNAAMEEMAAKAGLEVVSDYSNIFIMKIIDSYSPALALLLGSVFDQLALILWFTGIPIVLFINALQKINVSIYEAAKIDSANAWQIMWKITIPMLRSIGMIVTIFTVIQLGMFDTINPVYQLIVDATGDTSGGLGYAATYSWIYSLLVLVIIGVVFLLFKEKKGKRGA